MGFNFRGLTSSALVSNNSTTNHAGNTDIADVPRAVDAHTSMDIPRPGPDEKIGADHSLDGSSDTDEELAKIDEKAQQGVQNVQAMTFVWSKQNLILAYVM
jgi:microsomal dipeptidase-like Zn-dependent dipeptidase